MTLKNNSLTTLEEIKAFMVVEHDEDDDRLAALHLAAERRLEVFAGRPITATEVTEYFDGGRSRLFLPRYPISSSADLTIIDTNGIVAETNNETVEAAYYRVYHQKGTVQRASHHGQPRRWNPGSLRYKVTYTGGLDQMTDWAVRHQPILAQSIHLLVLKWYDQGAQVLSQGTKDAVKVSTRELPPEVAAIWQSYEPVGI
jgi:hypothetical protein